jgi:hypothetical protein
MAHYQPSQATCQPSQDRGINRKPTAHPASKARKPCTQLSHAETPPANHAESQSIFGHARRRTIPDTAKKNSPIARKNRWTAAQPPCRTEATTSSPQLNDNTTAITPSMSLSMQGREWHWPIALSQETSKTKPKQKLINAGRDTMQKPMHVQATSQSRQNSTGSVHADTSQPCKGKN